MPDRSRLVVVAASLAATVCVTTVAQADDARKLLTQINDYRSQEQVCEGRRIQPPGPLAPSAALGEVRLRAGKPLQQALQEVGYNAASSQAVVLRGPRNVRTAFKAMKDSYCEALLDGSFAEAGISRDGQTWQLLLARPLLAADLGDWEAAGRSVLDAVNAARAEPRVCGTQRLHAAEPLEWSQTLAEAALAHSQDMARRNYFSHRAPDGTTVGDRARRADFAWRQIGENIAAGQGSVEQVVAGWLSSPGHCGNLMSPAYTHMGAAYALDDASDARIYWTQVFGTPRR